MKIKINHPCTENYQAMEIQNDLAFCAKCEKNIHNLSSLTPSAIDAFMSQHRGEAICARLKVSQMTGSMEFWRVPMILGIAGLSIISLASCQSVHSKEDKEKKKVCKSTTTEGDSIAVDSIYQEEPVIMGDILYMDAPEMEDNDTMNHE